MVKKIKNFDFSTFSLYGQLLIEASAGTGKTHILIMIYLRLILGINDNQNFKKLNIKNILVLTFTKIATEELRERIRNSICELRSVCMSGYSKNLFFSQLLKEIDDINLAYKRLYEAEKNIDNAQIFTIHGFCQHILKIYPIELNSIFEYTILENEMLLFEKSCNDFWRRHFYPLPFEIINIIKKYWNTPKDLLTEIYPYLNNMDINVKPCLKGNIINQHEHIINYINYVKKIWNEEKNDIFDLIDNFSCSRRIYNSKNLKRWYDNINLWSNEKNTKNYTIPKELKYFQHSFIIKNIYIHEDQILNYSFFKSIEILYKTIISLKQLILNIAIREVRKIIKYTKYLSSEISFNDLIYLLDNALHCKDVGKKLSKLICLHYPVVIIDEFQDTDFQQYRIFRKLYSFSQSNVLLLIGDPKQSIYSFRGADIFSYLLARKNVDFHYTLDTNWRSSRNMVNAINTLFQFNSSYPFIFPDIPFIPMKISETNQRLRFMVENKLYPALCFWLPTHDKLTLHEYREIMANQCAYIISDLLNHANHNDAWLQNGENKRLLQASDIVILVRDRNEGFLISSVLKKFNIATAYFSNQDSIFKTDEAIDLLLILEAVLNAEDNNILRRALVTKIIGYNAEKIAFINHDIDKWEQECKEFINYCSFWRKYGVQPMLQEMIFRRSIHKILLSTEKGEQCLINILHLSEILQKKSGELNNESALVQWLNMKIHSYNMCSNDELLRSKSNCKLVKIMTIHRSKGLEFPLVFLPFIPAIYKKKYPIFHNRKNYQIYIDLNTEWKHFNLSEEERLSEDLRLFYVAITRAIYYCFVGIGSIFFKKNNKKKNVNDLHYTALGHLLQNSIPGDFSFLKKCLNKLVKYGNGDIVCNFVSDSKNQYCKLLNNGKKIEDNIIKQKNISAKNWNISIDNMQVVTSYTELHRFIKRSSVSVSNFKFQENDYYQNNEAKNYDLLTPHIFPRGNISGNFLHHIFQKWNFQKPLNREWLILELNKQGIDAVWLSFLPTWMKVIANTSLDGNDLMLSKISSFDYSTELQFYVSINNSVSAKKFDKICKEYDPISYLSSPLQFSNITGMLHGFIDLVFYWRNKYYLIDYKSDWLGNTYDNYDKLTMEHSMIIHHYALQYQIYTLALHRFLRYKLLSYDYDKDFGGVYYLFLRGINSSRPGNGIYFCRPNKLLIDKLDKLLSL